MKVKSLKLRLSYSSLPCSMMCSLQFLTKRVGDEELEIKTQCINQSCSFTLL